MSSESSSLGCLASQEHSGAFLQKVRKTDVPDYYEGVSGDPMCLLVSS